MFRRITRDLYAAAIWTLASNSHNRTIEEKKTNSLDSHLKIPENLFFFPQFNFPKSWTIRKENSPVSGFKLCMCICACLTLLDLMDCGLPGSSIHGILQARILGWIAISYSRGYSQPRDQTWVSYIAGRFFTVWATRKTHMRLKRGQNLFHLN